VTDEDRTPDGPASGPPGPDVEAAFPGVGPASPARQTPASSDRQYPASSDRQYPASSGGQYPADDGSAGWSKPAWASPSPAWRPDDTASQTGGAEPRAFDGYGTWPTGWAAGSFGASDQTGPPLDTLASPSPPRRPLMLIFAVVAALIVVAAAAFAFVANHHSHSTAHPAPSAQGTPPAQQPGGTIAPSGPPTTPAQVTTGPLDGYLLPASAIGPNVRIVLIPGGRDAVTQPTLDFCNYSYTSERKRTQRVQVRYEGGAVAVSEEFVKYQPGATQLAAAELQKAIATCPPSFRDGNETVTQITHVTGVTGLANNATVLTFAARYADLGAAISLWTTAVYQFDGNYFAGVYVYGSDRQAVQNEAIQLGQKATVYLREAAAGKPGTGGGPILTPPSSSPSTPGSQV